jgi:glycosyltransferase involved in cell wall biosynthesis
VRVTVCAPPAAERAYDFSGAGAAFAPVPRGGSPAGIGALRTTCYSADVVHAHGLHAALRAVVALRGLAVPLVVTWYGRPHAKGARAHLQRLLERKVSRAATVVLGVCSELVDLARSRGARDARLAPVTIPAQHRRAPHPEGPDSARHKVRAELGSVGRPLLVAVGDLDAHCGHRLLLDAAAAWRALDPLPLLVIAGEGPERVLLQSRIDTEDLPVRLLGRRDDTPGLLAAADLAVLPSRWEARAELAQEALHAGVPLVATAVGGVPELVGDAAVLVPYGDVPALARAVAALLADPARRELLAVAGRGQAAGWPTEDETVAQILGVYDELAQTR